MVEYAPGMRTIIRDEEWMVKKIETNSLGNKALYCVGISPLVKYREKRKMTGMNKLNAEALEQVTGGKLRMVCNDSVDYANVRTGPGTRYSKAYTLRNVTYVDTVRKVFSEEDGYYWTQIDDGCWIASHILQ